MRCGKTYGGMPVYGSVPQVSLRHPTHRGTHPTVVGIVDFGVSYWPTPYGTERSCQTNESLEAADDASVWISRTY